MGKFLAGLFAGAIFLLMLVTILTLAANALAASIANLMVSTALLTSQCVMGFVVLLAVISTALNVWSSAILAQRRNVAPQMPPLAVYPAMQSAARPYSPALPQLMPGQRQPPVIYVAGEQVVDEEEVGDTLFSNWGW